MTRFLSSMWAAVAVLLLGRAYGAQARWEEVLERLGRPHEYQSAAIIMGVVSILALLVSGAIATRSRALVSYPIIAITGLLFFYALLMVSLGMHNYEPAYSTAAVLALLVASGATCVSAIALRRRGEA